MPMATVAFPATGLLTMKLPDGEAGFEKKKGDFKIRSFRH
jgi:hypothetical protein